MGSKAPRYFDGLDGLRGVAALAVVVHHSHRILGFQPLPHGYLAVDFFFILSGFVIAHAYQAKLASNMSLVQFAKARFDRLYPMLFLGIVAGGVGFSFRQGVAWIDVAPAMAAQLVLLPAPFLHGPDATMWALNPPAWSLFWEVAASLAFALFLARASDRALRWLWLGFAACLIVVGFRWTMVSVGFEAKNALCGIPRTGVSFTLGVILWRAFDAGAMDRWMRRPSLAMVALLLLGVFAIPQPTAVVDAILVLVVLPLLLIAGVLSLNSSCLWNWLGRVSYPLYLIHFPVLFVFQAFLLRGAGLAERFAWFAIYLVVALIAALLITVLWDEPVRRKIRDARLARKGGDDRAASFGGAMFSQGLP
ncbi:acyltransferase [Novosphingobium sp. BL-8A]|uniref:acyltransferase family protein n=1 Tax=Novosphingobium sp. BL-8A TaxID=3127639 RepID=UPI0037583170